MVNLGYLFALAALGAMQNAFVEAEDGDKPLPPQKISLDKYVCTHPPYKIHVFSKAPLVIYIENFMTADERSHLHALAEPDFRASTVLNSEGDSAIHSIRSSQSTTISRDVVVDCIETRALEFQGFNIPRSHIEAIQLVKYGATERYNFHTDWFGDARHAVASQGGNRVSSFFGYIQAYNVTGGGTNFPALDPTVNRQWCKFIDCDQPYDNGVTFRPIEGNAVFWDNLLETGWGDMRTMHAGLPVVTGQKIGMNIWTRHGPVSPGWAR